MTFTPEFWDRLRNVLKAAPTDRFVQLLRIARLDPKKDLRHGDLRGCDLSDEDLADFDFTGANLTGANLDRADLSRAIGLDKAIGLERATYDAATTWPSRFRPWADAAGRDDFGPWASFTITPKSGPPATQRLRWIPPGAFRMGSPKDEAGRWDDREDQSETITFAQGFWLFETPCTQVLWTAVMDKNPSRFKSLDRPVETVSFKDAQRFIQRLNRMKRGLSLTLPSEAQWEYACRAGTTEATYAGPMQILGENNAPELDDIAWYGGNSGVGFDLDNGYDTSGWKDKQYDHNRAGTHPIGLKKPNAWGLHDMLGNVWEWCADEWHDTHEGAALDGSARDSGGSAAWRVIRGGSWFDDARYVRAACRYGFDPEGRDGHLGFRCVRVLSVSQASDKPRVAGRGKRRERSDQVAASGRARRRGTWDS